MDLGKVAITGGTALLGAELTPVTPAVVVIEGERVVGAGRAGLVDIPPDATVVDVPGCTLMPGFVDAHIHTGFYPPAEVVAGGVTTVRDLGSPPEEIFPLVSRSTNPDFDGPRILAAGQMLTVAGGYPTRAPWARPETGIVVGGPENASSAVERQADGGATVIKVALNDAAGPTLELDSLRAIIEAARDRGLRVTGHVHSIAELSKALEAGMDELAHMLLSAKHIPDEVISQMVAADMTVVPTLCIHSGPELAATIDNLRRFHDAGGRVIYGTDLGNDGPTPGIEARELKAMAAAGMSPKEIIASATMSAASYLGLVGTGAIEPGMYADLVAVAGDPLTDVSRAAEIRMVWRRGRIIR